MRTWMLFHILLACLSLNSCAAGMGGESGSMAGNEGGSDPINPSEEREYKRAVLKCYKTGGSRVVKIQGKLMCY